MIDIEKGTVDIDESSGVPSMPDPVSQSLLVRLRKAALAHQVHQATLPTPFTYEETREQCRSMRDKTNKELKETFLDMLVSLFGDIYNHMIVGERHFDRPAYLQSRHDDERSFFIEVLSSDAFDRFVDERMANHQRRDAFAVLGERVAAQRKAPSRSRNSSVIHPSQFQHLNPIFLSITERFPIPLFMDESLSSGNFYRVYCNSLTKRLEEINAIKDIKLKACLLYLRGFAQIACDYPIEGLRDFHALYATVPELFPREFTAEIISSLNPNILAVLQKESFYKQTAMFRTYTTKELDRKRNTARKIPNDPMNKPDFEKRVKTLNKLTLTTEQVDWLFNVMSEDNQMVEPETYRNFYKAVAEIDKLSENREISGVMLDKNHPVLTVSQPVSTSHATGRLVLTTENLYLVPNGARDPILITKVIDIKELIKYHHHSVFYAVQAVRIINSGKE